MGDSAAVYVGIIPFTNLYVAETRQKPNKSWRYAVTEYCVEVDPDILRVIAYMQENITASKLVSSASALPEIARLLWGRYRSGALQCLVVEAD